MRTLDQIAEITLGKAQSSDSMREEGDGIKMIFPKNITSTGLLDLGDVKWMKNDDKTVIARNGDVLIVLAGPNAGKYAIFDSSEEITFSQNIAKIRSVNGSEIIELLDGKSSEINALINNKTMIPRISTSDLKKLKIN